MWKELTQEFPKVFDHYTEKTLWNVAKEREMKRPLTLWNVAKEREMKRPLTQVTDMQRKEVVSHKQITQNRLWNKRSDGIAFKMPTTTKVSVICL